MLSASLLDRVWFEIAYWIILYHQPSFYSGYGSLDMATYNHHKPTILSHIADTAHFL